MEAKTPLEDLENYGDMNVGDILRRTRLHYGQSLQDIERALRIRESQLNAIENGEFEKLPGRVYAVGFVRTYAEYLGLDGGKMTQLFKSQYVDNQPRKELVFPLPASESRTPSSWIVFISLFVALAVILGWFVLKSDGTKSIQEIPSVPQEVRDRIEEDVIRPSDSASKSSLINKESDTPEQIAEEVLDENKNGIILNILSDSWVEIKDAQGKKIVSETLKAGDQYFVPNSPGLTMSLGNAGGVELVLDGAALKPLGKNGVTKRDIPLETAYLKTLEFKEPIEPSASQGSPLNDVPESEDSVQAHPTE